MWVKSIGFINKTLRENIAVRAYMRNANGPMFENCWVFWKQINPLNAESKLSQFLHQSDDQKILSWYRKEKGRERIITDSIRITEQSLWVTNEFWSTNYLHKSTGIARKFFDL